MYCQCNAGYNGLHCNECDFGFYRKGNYCEPCNCSDNQKTDVKDFCDRKTGYVQTQSYRNLTDCCVCVCSFQPFTAICCDVDLSLSLSLSILTDIFHVNLC